MHKKMLLGYKLKSINKSSLEAGFLNSLKKMNHSKALKIIVFFFKSFHSHGFTLKATPYIFLCKAMWIKAFYFFHYNFECFGVLFF